MKLKSGDKKTDDKWTKFLDRLGKLNHKGGSEVLIKSPEGEHWYRVQHVDTYSLYVKSVELGSSSIYWESMGDIIDVRPIKKGIRAKKLWSIAWSLPNSLLGIMLFTFLGMVPRKIDSQMCIWLWQPRWGFWRWWSTRYAGITFGHVVGLTVINDKRRMTLTQAHEFIHVRQNSIFGPFFIPCYLLEMLEMLIKGKRPYLDIKFEIEAYARQDEVYRHRGDIWQIKSKMMITSKEELMK